MAPLESRSVTAPREPEGPFPYGSVYREAGVREYWVCDPARERTLAYRFGEGAELLSVRPFAEPVESEVLPGFSADLAAIVAGM